MDIGQQALLRTVDRVLTERGEDPEIVSAEDKVVLGAQYIQLCALHEHALHAASQELAEALGASPQLALAELVAEAVAEVREYRRSNAA